MLPPLLSDEEIVKIADDLAAQGYCIFENVLPPTTISLWRAHANTLSDSGQLKRASIGRASQQAVSLDVRSDHIAWLEEGSDNLVDQAALAFIEQLRAGLNQQLYLGADQAEAHFARYPPGGHYSKHLDRHRNSDARVLSFILYLNETWQPEWGGQLRMYDSNDALLRAIEPRGGTLVLFRSEQFPHEVVACTHPRMSLTGWLRRRN